MNVSGTIYLLDTNVIRELMRSATGKAALRYRTVLSTKLRNPGAPTTVVTSLIVQCELLLGLRRNPAPRLHASYELMMGGLPVLPLDEALGPVYAGLRTDLEQAGTSLEANDLLIAAHALSIGATLVSDDAAFARVPGLKIENWLT
jgi:tRNA(fMet)-specific endonuclease VapC